MASSNTRTVVITGASTGIGHACAKVLAKSGFHVFAGVRKEEDAKKLKNKVKEFSSQVSSESSETSDDSQGLVLPLEGQ